MEREKILVVGGAGFIGSHLVDRLIELGYDVTVFDNLSCGSMENLAHVDSYQFIHGDIRDYETLRRLFKKRRFDVVYHAAAQISVDRGISDPIITHDVNVTGTLNLLNSLLKLNKPTLFIYFSSCEVYGNAEYVPMNESHPLNSITPYAATKLAAEKYVTAYSFTYDFPAIIVRPFNAFGPRQRSGQYGGVIPNFIQRIKRGLPPIIHGDGEQSRDFTYVKDVSEAFSSLATRKDLLREIINLGSGNEVTINELAETLIKIMGRKDLKPIHVRHPRKTDITRQKSDTSKAQRLIGYRPRTNFEEALKKTSSYFLSF